MRFIKVFSDKRPGKRNSWNWHVEEPSRRVTGKPNVLYTAQGYDTKVIAYKQARAHNKTLKKELRIKIFSKEGKYQTG